VIFNGVEGGDGIIVREEDRLIQLDRVIRVVDRSIWVLAISLTI
jgi:hypothetical protein